MSPSSAFQHCFLAVDLGAESGRVMAGLWDGRQMRLEEVHRFANAAVHVGPSLRWDLVHLLGEIEAGLTKAAERYGSAIVSLGVDTWAVDFALLSRSGELLGLPRHYRDPRNERALGTLLQRVPREEIFAASGIQFMPINTLCQLAAMQEENPELLAAAETFLMIPDFVNWSLAGTRVVEFTNATTTQFFHPTERRWSTGLLERLEIPTRMLPEVVPPGTMLGGLLPPVRTRTGLGDVKIIAPATHDTGSAVAAVPSGPGETSAYVSSGTWSLLGVEVPAPILSPEACTLNFTNEGGLDGTYRLLKNIMGLWLVQQCRRALERRGEAFDYATLVAAAELAPPLRSLIDPDDARFLNPEDMLQAIVQCCREHGEAAPTTPGEFIRCVLESLALKYAVVLGQIESLTGRRISALHIVGGGSRNSLLNQFAANACRCPVLAGPVEATALGNVLVQARSMGEVSSRDEIRRISRESSDLREFTPEAGEEWAAARARFQRLLG